MSDKILIGLRKVEGGVVPQFEVKNVEDGDFVPQEKVDEGYLKDYEDYLHAKNMIDEWFDKEAKLLENMYKVQDFVSEEHQKELPITEGEMLIEKSVVEEVLPEPEE